MCGFKGEKKIALKKIIFLPWLGGGGEKKMQERGKKKEEEENKSLKEGRYPVGPTINCH